MNNSKKRREFDLTDIRKLLKEKSISEVMEKLEITNRQCFFKFCASNFITIPKQKKEMSCKQTR